MTTPRLMAGFEAAPFGPHRCLLTSDGHLPHKAMDYHYDALKALGIVTVRDALPPWLPLAARLRTAWKAGMAVVWDLDHYWQHEEPTAYALRVASAVRRELPEWLPFWVCFNELHMAPMLCGLPTAEAQRRARIILTVLRDELPVVGLWTAEPAHHQPEVEAHAPLADEAEVIGLNLYPHELSRPVEEVLRETAARYPGKRIAITETGAHVGHFWRVRGDLYPPDLTKSQWLRHVREAVERSGVPVESVCLYPAIDGLNWTDHHLRNDSGLLRPDGEPDPDLAAAVREWTGASAQEEAA